MIKKKLWKLLTSVALCITLTAVCLCNLPVNTQATEGDLTFSLNSDGEGYTVKSCNPFYSGNLIIPSTYNGKPVTGIGASALKDIPVTGVYIPDSVISIGNSAFSGCYLLQYINIPDGVTSIGSSVFSGCRALTDISIPDSVTSIGSCAFDGCCSLASITIPDSVTSIGASAFKGCRSLKNITIPFLGSNCKSRSPFGYIFGTVNYDGATGILQYYYDSATYDIYYIPQNLKSVTVTGGEIFYGAFSNCEMITSITIGDSVKGIGGRAFYGCSSLTGITIPNGVTGIGECAFYNCKSLSSVTIPDSVTGIGNSAFENCSSLTGIVIPNSVTSVGDTAFRNCSNLNSVTVGDRVTSIGYQAFYNCSSLTSVYITDIAAWCNVDFDYALSNPLYYADNFYLNGELVTELEIPVGVTNINTCAFYNYGNLIAVTIPETVTYIGNAFYQCCNLETIRFYGDAPIIAQSAFAGVTATAYYLIHKSTWTADLLQNYGGTITWQSYCIHQYTPAVTPPSCTAGGYTTYTCTFCGDGYITEETEATGHRTVVDRTVAPTCTETGLTEGNHCSICNAVLLAQEVIPALGHSVVIDEAVAPSCTETGLTEGNHCSVCDTVLLAQEVIPALGHSVVIDAAVVPTCTETGLTEGNHCSICNTVLLAQEVIPALGHSVVIDAAVVSTCTETGLTEGNRCSICNTVLLAQEVIPALGHSVVIDAAVVPTCTETGLTEGNHCSICNAVLLAKEVIPALGHSVVIDEAVAPTCTETGLTEGNHCSACNTVLLEQEVIPALGHKYESVITPPTCMDAGYTTYTCPACGDYYVKDYTSALGHSYSFAVTAPTCTTTGYTTYTCSVCDEHYVADYVKAFGHSYEAVVTAPTCAEGGYTTYVCTACSYSYVSDYTKAFGHTYETVLTAPTCTDGGCTTYTCAICADSYIANKTEALGHRVSGGVCTACKKVLIKITTQPVSKAVKDGATAKFTVKATGNGLKYQWQYRTSSSGGWKNASATGNKTKTLSVAATAAKHGYQYRCKVTDTAGNTVYTSVVTLNVLGIKTQPVDKTVKDGVTAKFTVAAVGDGLTYQWQYRTSSSGSWKNASATGNKTKTLSVAATVAKHGYQYRCKVTDTAGNTVYTSVVTLNVLGIKTQPASKTVKAGATAKFTVAAVGDGLTYQWQYRTSSSGSWKNASAAGNKTKTLSVSASVSHHGYQYRCKITDSAGNTVYTKAVSLYVLGIKTQPANKTVKAGATAKFTVTATGKGLTYQWQYRTSSSGSWKNVSTASGKTANYSLTAAARHNGYQYRCKITDSAGNVIYTSIVKLTVK